MIAARRQAGLTQRQLAERAGVPQSTVGRIENGSLDPRTGTLDRLLKACGRELHAVPRPGEGVDRTQIRERLRLTPTERVDHAVAAARNIERFRGAARRKRR